MNYHKAKCDIAVAASHIGHVITRHEAITRLAHDPAAQHAARVNNPLNAEIIGYRDIGGYIVELALVDFNGWRGCGYSCGITVFGHHDLSECVDIGDVGKKLRAIRDDGAAGGER